MTMSTFLAFAGPACGVVIALIAGWFGRANSKASAAKAYTDMSMDVAEELRQVRLEMRGLRAATEELVGVVGDVIPLLEGEHPAVVLKLERARSQVRKVI
ncbi:hypothetical protein KXR83_05865 [Williamsia muralis]|uniref:hypothetical protein n=1 Tax=Williamsia marianensis TaxID=85044 RepID=UPI003F13D7A8